MRDYLESFDFEHGIKGYLVADDSPESPREWCNASIITCFHRRYDIGDPHKYADSIDLLLSLAADAMPDGIESIGRLYREPGESWESAAAIWSDELWSRVESNPDKLWAVLDSNYVILPVYMYEHSGIALKCSAFSCPWDSGQVGFAYMSREKAIEETGRKRFDKQTRDHAAAMIRGEVETLSQYVNGEVYGIVIEDSDGDCMDSCFGFYGWQYAESELRDMAAACVAEREKEIEAEKLEHAAMLESVAVHEQFVIDMTR